MTTDVEAIAAVIVAHPKLQGYKFDRDRVAAVIEHARVEYTETAAVIRDVADPAGVLVGRLKTFQNAVRKAIARWEAFSDAERNLVLRFDAPGPEDRIGNRLRSLDQLLADFADFYGRDVGNTRKTRDGRNISLEAIDWFVRPIMSFWEEETRTTFGSAINEPVFDTPITAGKVSQKYLLDPASPSSPAMIFLAEASKTLGAHNPGVGSLQTVVRRLKGLDSTE